MQPLGGTTLNFVFPHLSPGSCLFKNLMISSIHGSIETRKDEFFRLRQLGRTVAEYETELRELAEFVLEVINSEDYLCSKFEEGLNLEVREKMFVSGNQSYKKVVQLAVKAEKLANERFNRGKFQKRKNFGFLSGQSSKKSKSFESSEHSFGSGTESVSSPQAFRAPQPSRLGTSPPSSTF